MKKNKTAFLLAGILLIVSAVFSQVLEKNMGQALVLSLSGLFFSILAFFKQGQKQIACETRMLKKHPVKVILVTLGVTVIFGGIGFLFGQLLYHVVN